MCLTLGHEADATHLVSKRIGKPRRAAAQITRLREYAMVISTSPVFAVTLPMPLFG
jgi:hypothetical protein